MLSVGLLAANALVTKAQSVSPTVYLPDNFMKVYSGAGLKDMAWSGGVNCPQFCLADLNKDGKKDLVVFEEFVGVQTYINQGTTGNPQYVYNPAYEANFPSEIVGYMKLEDYNRDGIPDLFHRGAAGFNVSIGYWTTDNKLAFRFYKELYYYLNGSGWINAYVEPVDIPAVIDIDKDGDLDFLAYYIGGGNINFYRNCQIEEGLPKDSIKLCVKDVCWGRAFQNYTRVQQLAYSCFQYGTTCKGCGSENKTTHAGNALCFLDYDGDSDYDFFDGNVSFPDIQLLINGRANYSLSIDSIVSQDTLWSSNGVPMSVPIFPGAFWLDIDQDGDKDLLFSPHQQNSENYKNIIYYKNMGSDAHPNFVYQSDTFLVQNMIDNGYASYPFFYDYNKDGKPDLFIGSDGYYQSNGTLRSRLSYFENTTTGSNKSFTLQSTDFLNLNSLNLKGTAPAIGDLDNDGKDELILGMTDGTVLLFNNNAASGSVQPVWVQASTKLKNNSGADIDVGNYAAPFIYDVDSDGKKDLVVGNQAGDLYYYHNIGTGSGIKLAYAAQNLGGVKIAEPGNIYNYSAPFIGKLDNTGKTYLLVGSQSGMLYRYDGLQGGNTTVPYTLVDSGYSKVYAGPRSVPAIADIDTDGRYDMVVGNVLGGVKLFKQYFNVGIDNVEKGNNAVKVYPNPAKDQLYISWDETFSSSDRQVEISLISVTGQRVSVTTVSGSRKNAELNIPDLPSGVYYCIIKSGVDQAVKPVSIVK